MRRFGLNLKYVWFKICKKIIGTAINESIIAQDAKVEAGSTFVMSKMGRFSYCGYDCYIINAEIGAFCSISDNVSIGGATHPMNWISTSSAFYKGRDSISKRLASLSYDSYSAKTFIGNDVWIGRGAYIKAGVKIDNGAVIGMGSVVTKDVGPFEVWAGNPARLIRKRFTDEVIEAITKTRWWDEDENSLFRCGTYINDVDSFLNFFKE